MSSLDLEQGDISDDKSSKISEKAPLLPKEIKCNLVKVLPESEEDRYDRIKRLLLKIYVFGSFSLIGAATVAFFITLIVILFI